LHAYSWLALLLLRQWTVYRQPGQPLLDPELAPKLRVLGTLFFEGVERNKKLFFKKGRDHMG
jgi:hypothetical protein